MTIPLLFPFQATAEMDAGPVWASKSFPIPNGARKTEIYNTAAADAALCAVKTAVRNFQLLRKHQQHSKTTAAAPSSVFNAAAAGGAAAAGISLGPVLPQLLKSGGSTSSQTTHGAVVAFTSLVEDAGSEGASADGLSDTMKELPYPVGVGRAFHLAAQDQEYGCELPLMRQASRR